MDVARFAIGLCVLPTRHAVAVKVQAVVEARAFARVAENAVRLSDLLEAALLVASLAVRRARMPVRMVH